MMYNELSYYHESLQDFLNCSHPQLAANRQLVEERSQLAYQEYGCAMAQGFTHEQALEFAEYALYRGLLFSSYIMLLELVRQMLHLSYETAKEKTLKLLPACEPIFKRYPMVGDDFTRFSYPDAYNQLKGELESLITKKCSSIG